MSTTAGTGGVEDPSANDASPWSHSGRSQLNSPGTSKGTVRSRRYAAWAAVATARGLEVPDTPEQRAWLEQVTRP